MYTLGPPEAPMNFHASPSPNGYVLTWTDMSSKDQGIDRYQFRSGPDEKWDGAKVGDLVKDLDPGEYMFMLRAIGMSTNGDSAKADSSNKVKVNDVLGDAAPFSVMVPTPTPTLPELVTLLLAMLLLGSGAYLLRRRQSGGLTPA